MDAETTLEIAARFDNELAERFRFIYEIDRLKSVVRKNLLSSGERQENSAEHSWHVAMTAMVMAPYANDPIDLGKVMKMLLIHDIIEVDAGDIDIFDTAARAQNEANEQRAADRIFGLLPEPDSSELRALWGEYEEGRSPDARFAYSCDRLQPFLLNVALGGQTWDQRGVTATDVREVNGKMTSGLAAVWPVAESIIAAAVSNGTLKP